MTLREAIKPEEPIEIEGVLYHRRRLGLEDLFVWGDIIREVLGRGGLELTIRLRGMDLSKPDTVMALLIMGFSSAQERLLDHLASLYQVDPKTFRDPEVFPLPSFPILLKGLGTHKDFAGFFTAWVENLVGIEAAIPGLEKVKELFQTMKTPSADSSTDSLLDTD